MGNQTSEEPILRKPPLLANIPKQGSGFNSYDQDIVVPSKQTANAQFANIICTVTLKQHQSPTLEAINENQIDDFIDYKEPEIQKQFSFVPKQNITSDINMTFEYLKQLGTGASCRVIKAKHIQNNNLYAIKELTKKHEINAQLFSEEVKLLRKLMHPNILTYYDCYMDNQCYYIATEFCDGGTMLDKIIKMKSFSEQKASQYIATILSAVNYMHDLNIVHRDLKAQNMVFDKHGIDGVLQIIDFGDSKIIKEDEIYSEFVGTIHYVAPEIVRKRTGKELKKSDLWSVGIIAYLLVCGSPPFTGITQKEILKNIINKEKCELLYPKGIGISKACMNFIESLLCHDIDKRLSAADALKHEWICGAASTDNLSVEVLKSLQRYHYNNKLQDILVHAILSEMDMSEQKILSQGLMNMNREVSNMDNDKVVEYLLLNASIQHMPAHSDKKWQQKRMSEIKLFHDQSLKTLEGLENVSDGTSSPIIISENVFVPSKVSNNDSVLDVLDGFDIDGIIDAVDKKEKELETLESTTITKEQTIINKTVSNGSTVSSEDIQARRISVERFRSIMKKSSKQYDVEDIIHDLDDGTGHIPLNKIASYTKRIKTEKNLFFSMDSNKLKEKDNGDVIEKSNTM